MMMMMMEIGGPEVYDNSWFPSSLFPFQEYKDYCRRNVTFNFVGVNLCDDKKNVEMGEHFEFTDQSTDWGFPRFLALERMKQERGFVVDGHIFVEVGNDDDDDDDILVAVVVGVGVVHFSSTDHWSLCLLL